MSRSFKHNLITGYSTAKSEKKDKQSANRKLRRKANQGDYDITLNEVSDTWSFAKDGKHYFKDDDMRK